ncbi:hypothetical protein CC80DRAFT_434389, partial [Byssothecium circinans]
MAASSQYHRGATTPTSHYHPLPSSHEHLYANLATTWTQASQSFSRSPPPSALLQRFISPPVQRPFAGHYQLDYPDYVNQPAQHQHPHPHPHPHQQPPPPQQQQQHQHHTSWSGWSGPASDDAFAAPRALSFGGEARAPHYDQDHAHNHDRDRDRDRVSAHDASLARPHPRASDNLSAAPVARTLNYQNSDLHVDPPHALPSDVVLANQASLGGANWAMLSSADASNTTSPVYEHMPAMEPAWSQVDAQPEHLAYLQHPQSLVHAHHDTAASRGARTRRSAPKKSVARVPAAFVERQEKNKISKRQGPLSEASRQKTHQMRKDKTTCLRCRFYKSGCDGGDPCQKCLKTEGNARSFKLPCIRERLEDATLVRHCNGRSNQEEGEFLAYDWLQNCQLYDMEIIWNLPGYGPVSTSQPMRITFRQYAPQRPFLDTTTNMWSNTDGQIKVVEQPPYAVYDTASLIPIFERYFSHLQPAIEAWIFDRVQHDEIALLTYNEVMRLRRQQPPGQRSLLDLVMRIQCLSVVSQGYGTVWSNNIPGIQTVDFASLGRSVYEAYDRNSRDRPLPGAINHQMDVAALKYLKKLERQCVKELSAMMFKSKIKPWYELFLALYVLFWNMEYIHRGANKYIMSKNGT